LFANLIGLIPCTFTVTSQLIITVTFALLVFFIVVGYGFWKNGLRFFNTFVPKGVPKLILPAIVAIEVLSFLSRPVSHSVRLFANMLAGHITLQVFAGFVIMLGSAGILGGFVATLPFIMVGGLPASLCVCHSHLHLSERCISPGSLTAYSIIFSAAVLRRWIYLLLPERQSILAFVVKLLSGMVHRAGQKAASSPARLPNSL